MAEGTRDCHWEYEEVLWMESPAAAADTAGLWADALRGNQDFIHGDVEIAVINGDHIRVRYSWNSRTKVWVKTDGRHYGLAHMPKGEPHLYIKPDKKIEIPTPKEVMELKEAR